MHTEGWAENCRRVKGHEWNEHSIATHPKGFLLFMMTVAAFFDCLESMYDANLIFLSSWRTFSPKWVSLLCAPVIRSSVRMLSIDCKNGFELAEGIGRCKDRFLAILWFKSGRGECVFCKDTNSVRKCMIKFGSCQYEVKKTNVLINAHSNLCLFCLHIIG